MAVAVTAELMTGPVEFTVMCNVADPVPVMLVAEIVTVLTPVAVGVPEITPVVELIARPAGSPVAP